MVPPALRVRLGLIAVLAALTVLVLGVLYAGDSEPGPVDARIGTAADGVGPPWRHVALALDFLGEPAGAATLVVAPWRAACCFGVLARRCSSLPAPA